MNPSLLQAASDYFSHLARHFPVMCASDEFHFMPRVQEAAQYYDRVEDFHAGFVEEQLSVLADYRALFHRLSSADLPLEDAIDCELLKASAAGICLEFSRCRSWRHNPLFYLKIAFIGLDHALNKPCGGCEERFHRVRSRLEQLPRLLRQAARNLLQVPGTHRRAALQMASDCDRYLEEIRWNAEHPLQGCDPGLEATRAALVCFVKYLESLAPVGDGECPVPPVREILRDHLASVRSLTEVYELAGEDWSRCLEELNRLQREIGKERSWQELYHGYMPSRINEEDILDLYRGEMESLKAFFRGHGFETPTGSDLPVVCATPTYLRSTRSSASFSAAFTVDERERDFFYITADVAETRGPEAAALLRKRLHREFRFLTAHETFPGHFLLDSTRRRLPNPVRSQIESPLFYEGWAYYCESLLTECGYVEDPMECLVDWKRRLWRAGRCRVDVGTSIGLMSWEDAVEQIAQAGFGREEARNQVERYRLNPGYQLCYALGRFEIATLRERYAGRMGRDGFHRTLLEGGEIPFHLLEKRLQGLMSTDL